MHTLRGHRPLRMARILTLKKIFGGSHMAYLAPFWLMMIRYIAPAAILIILCHETGIVNLSHLFGGS